MVNFKRPLIVLLGPTATGKTELSLELAKIFPLEIVSSDSMQIYKFMDIGTSKVSKKIREEIPHHLIDIIEPDKDFSVQEYKIQTLKAIDEIYKKGNIPLLIGGTGLYTRSVIEHFIIPEVEPDENLRNFYNQLPKEELYQKLKTIDPEIFKNISKNDKKRIIRAIEIYDKTGKKPSLILKLKGEEEFEKLLIGLTIKRDLLYERINKRVDEMIEGGLIEEVKNLIDNNIITSKTAKQAIGYKEIIDYLNELITLKQAIELIKKRTRNYAKRQITWFKKDKDVKWIEVEKDNFEEVKNTAYNLTSKFLERVKIKYEC